MIIQLCIVVVYSNLHFYVIYDGCDILLLVVSNFMSCYNAEYKQSSVYSRITSATALQYEAGIYLYPCLDFFGLSVDFLWNSLQK